MIKPIKPFDIKPFPEREYVFLHAPDELVKAVRDLPYVLRVTEFDDFWLVGLSPLYDFTEAVADMERQLTLFAAASDAVGDE